MSVIYLFTVTDHLISAFKLYSQFCYLARQSALLERKFQMRGSNSDIHWPNLFSLPPGFAVETVEHFFLGSCSVRSAMEDAQESGECLVQNQKYCVERPIYNQEILQGQLHKRERTPQSLRQKIEHSCR